MLRSNPAEQLAVYIEGQRGGRVDRQLISDHLGDGPRVPHDICRYENLDHGQDKGVHHVGDHQNLHGMGAAEEDFELFAEAVHAVASWTRARLARMRAIEICAAQMTLSAAP